MRRAGGYGEFICDGPIEARDSFGRTVRQEHDTFSCGHCARVVFVNARERPEDIGGLCKVCMGLICGPCVDQGICHVVEKKLQDMERRQDTLRSYGMG